MQVLLLPFRSVHHLEACLQARLEDWERRPFWPGTESGPGPRDHRDSYVRVVAVEAPGCPWTSGPHRQIGDSILAYKIFPPRIVSGVLRRSPVEAGGTVGIHYRLVPGVGLFFAARVLSVFDEETREV